MEIKSVKFSGDGYLINGTKYVSVNDSNPYYKLVKRWLSEGNIPEPEFTQEEIDLQDINTAIEEAKKYLDDTDYKDLPSYEPKVDEDLDSIKLKRKEARDFIRANS